MLPGSPARRLDSMTPTTRQLEVDWVRDCWTADYWLEHSEGFAVENEEGVIGYVASVDSRHEPLVVLGERGVTTVPMLDVERVEPAGERLFVR